VNKILRNRGITTKTIFVALVAMWGSLLSMAAFSSVATTCNPVAEITCGLPFPSDLFADTDGTLNYSDNIFDKKVGESTRTDFTVRSQFSSNFKPSVIFNNSKGFSALGPVLFELPGWPAEEIHPTGEEQLVVFNRDTGAIVPMLVSLSKVANPEREFRQKSPVVIAWPRSRFEFDGQYVAVLLRNQLHTQNSGGEERFEPNAIMQRVLDGTRVWFDRVEPAYRPVLAFVNDMGVETDNILSMTYFTVRSESEVTTPVTLMIQKALSQTGYVNNLHKVSALDKTEDGLMTINGDLSLVNFRQTDGGIYPPFDARPDATLDRTDFNLMLPAVTPDESVPITLWGHGLANFKDYRHSDYRRADRLGIATVVIDHPNHGKRVTADPEVSPPIAVTVRSPTKMMHLLGMFVQTVIDHAVVARMAHDLLPAELAEFKESNPEVPSLDVTRMYYQGLSLGGMVGSTIGATAPYLEGAYLVNGASSLMQLFSESAMWDGNTSMVIPPNATGAEATLALAMMQHYIDIADGSNFAHWYQQPPPGKDPKKLGMIYAIGDGSVVNDVSLALAEIADLSLLKEVIEPVLQLKDGEFGRDGFNNGNGLAQTGYGYELAEQAVGEIKALDPNRLPDETGGSLFGDLFELDFGDDLLSESLESILSSVGDDTDVESFEEVVDIIYDGELESFLTHFNRSSFESVSFNIDWVCDTVAIDESRCAYAKEKAQEDADNPSLVDQVTNPDDSGLIDEIENIVGENGLDDFEVGINVIDGSGGATDGIFLSILALFILWRKRIFGALEMPAFRIVSSAVLSAATWFCWAVWINWGQGAQTWDSGIAQALSSFCTTLMGTWLLEMIFIRLGSEPFACGVNVVIVSTVSLLFMTMSHIIVDTQHLFFTVFPVYNVVVAFCIAYVMGLRRLDYSAKVAE